MTQLDTWMKANQLTTRALAERAGVNLVTVYRWRAGAKKIAPSRALEMAKTIGVPVHVSRPDLFDPPAASGVQAQPQVAA